MASTLLIVEDEAGIVEVAQSILEHAGYEVLVAMDGVSAVDVYQANADRISGVLLDLLLPGQNGDQVYIRLRESGFEGPVVLTSGHSEKAAFTEFSGAGSSPEGLAGYIQKPYPLRNLVALIAEVIGPA